jgi:hypothetical protein
MRASSSVSACVLLWAMIRCDECDECDAFFGMYAYTRA